MKKLQKIKAPLLLFIIMMITAVIGHSYYLYRFITEGIIFTGPNDGLEQMLPMQQYIYEKWTSGQFFYSNDFGLGGDFYTDLSYYYSTSIVFLINMILIRLGDIVLPFDTASSMFWVKNAFFISILKSAVAMMFTYYYFRRLSTGKVTAFTGAFLFVISAIYFRFTLYWSFFSDVFIFLPLLLLSIEWFIQEKRRLPFIISVALILINNFYFAYHLILIGAVYFIFRNIIRHEDDKLSRISQWTHIIPMAIIGLMISAYSFFYGVTSFLNNKRHPYEGEMKFFNELTQNENVFFDNYLVIVIFLTIPALLTFKFYKHYWYKFFAVATILTLLFNLTPYIDSLFNGLSAPQKRWHYLITFFSSGLIAMYIQRIRDISLQNYIYSMIPAFVFVFASNQYIEKPEPITWIWFIPVIFITGLLILIVKNVTAKNILHILLVGLVLLMNLDIIRLHHKIDNYNPGIFERANTKYVDSSVYNSPLQRQLVKELKDNMEDGERLDFRVLEQDNTPMYQSFNGASLYSSIFDGHIVDFYYEDLKINLKKESISRYSSFQSRSNLYSLFNVKYLLLKDYQKDIPANFSLYKDYGKYQAYQNDMMLPFVRIEDKVYHSDDLKNPIDREHAMIDGVILDDYQSTGKLKQTSVNWVDKTKLVASNAQWTKENAELTVNAPSGGLMIELPKKFTKKYKDVYIEMHVDRLPPQSNFQINVAGYANERLFEGSTYRTKQDDLLYRVKVPKNGKIPVGITPGSYNITVQGIYGEDYRLLKKKTEEKTVPYIYKDKGRTMEITLKQSEKGHMVIPVMYRDGMKAKVDGKSVKVSRANYLMTSVEVDEDTKNVTLTYTPPYFYLMTLCSLIGILLAVLYTGLIRKEKMKWKR